MAFSRNSFRRMCFAAVGATLVLAFGASNAFASCSYSTEGKTFSQWNDPSYYVPAPNGGLESSSKDWSLSGSSVVSDNESFFLGGSKDSHALSIPTGGSATSPTFCVEQGFPTFRFAVRNTGAWGATLKVEAIYLDSTHNNTTVTVGYLTAGYWWTPSSKMSLALGTSSDGGISDTQVQLRFTPMSGSGKFEIDDLYIDPWARY
jgi:hypothetical protein